jgi:hypothetical protein
VRIFSRFTGMDKRGKEHTNSFQVFSDEKETLISCSSKHVKIVKPFFDLHNKYVSANDQDGVGY